MTNTAAAENLAGRGAEKEKVEKRRALGRGLESLLPGPRVVAAVPKPVPADAPIVIQTVVDAGCLAGTFSARFASGRRAALGLDSRGRLSPRMTSDEDETITIFAQAETGGCRGILSSTWRLRTLIRIRFRRGMWTTTTRWRSWRIRFKANGVVQPIMVRPSEEEGRYILVLGERRLQASKKAGKTTIPALVRRVSLQQAAEMTIIENLQREDLSALEQAEAFRVLSKEFALTQQQIGERVGLSRESVSNYMRLLKLPEMVMERLAHKEFGFSRGEGVAEAGGSGADHQDGRVHREEADDARPGARR